MRDTTLEELGSQWSVTQGNLSLNTGTYYRLVAAQVIETKFMEFLREMSADQRIKSESWEKLTLEEKIPMLKSIAKWAHYDAHHGILEIVLHKGDKSRPFALKLAELKHISYHKRQAGLLNKPLLRQDLVLTHQINAIIKEKGCSLRKIVQWTGIPLQRICQIANMADISPRVQEEILFSQDKRLHKIAEYEIRDIISEVNWEKQEQIWKSILVWCV